MTAGAVKKHSKLSLVVRQSPALAATGRLEWISVRVYLVVSHYLLISIWRYQ